MRQLQTELKAIANKFQKIEYLEPILEHCKDEKGKYSILSFVSKVLQDKEHDILEFLAQIAANETYIVSMIILFMMTFIFKQDDKLLMIVYWIDGHYT